MKRMIDEHSVYPHDTYFATQGKFCAMSILLKLILEISTPIVYGVVCLHIKLSNIIKTLPKSEEIFCNVTANIKSI